LSRTRERILVEPAEQGPSGDPEELRGLGLVAGAASQSLQDPLTLERIDLGGGGRGAGRQRSGCWGIRARRRGDDGARARGRGGPSVEAAGQGGSSLGWAAPNLEQVGSSSSESSEPEAAAPSSWPRGRGCRQVAGAERRVVRGARDRS